MSARRFRLVWRAAVPVLAAAALGAAPARQDPQQVTVAAIRGVARDVAGVRGAMELFHRSAASAADRVVVERAEALGARCRDLERAAMEAASRLCRGCEPRDRQAALDAYRRQLPALQATARRCAVRIGALRSNRAEASAAAAYKREASAITGAVIEGLVPYERRLLAVRRAFGWAADPDATTSPAAPGRRP